MMAAMLDAEVEVGAGGADEAEAEAANLPRCQCSTDPSVKPMTKATGLPAAGTLAS